MRSKLIPIFSVCLLLLVFSLFFKETFISGKLPVPSDSLIGLYHPWRDMYAQEYPRGVPFKNFLITDPIRQQIPWRKLAVDSFKKEELPKFNPYSLNGVSLLGNIQSGALYPLNILFMILSFPTAWTILVMLQVFFAGLFMYIFLRDRELHPFSASLGGISWALSGFSIAWLTWGTMMQTAMWLPLLLFAIDGWREQKKGMYLVLYCVASCFAFFAGHVQIFFYIFVFSLYYACYRFFFSGSRTVEKSGMGYVLGIAFTTVCIVSITSVQWVSLYHVVVNTSRVAEMNLIQKEGWFLPFRHLIQFVIPDFFGNPATLNYWGTWNYGELVGYIGIVPFLLVLVAIINKRFILHRFWILSLIGVSIFLLPTPLAFLPYTLNIPFISSLQPTRLMVLVCFVLSVLAAHGLHDVLHEKPKRMKLLLLILLAFSGAVGFIILGNPYALSGDVLTVIKRNSLLPFVFAGIGFFIIWGTTKFYPYRYLFVILLLVITSVDLLRFGWKFTPFTHQADFFPETSVISFLQSKGKDIHVMTTDEKIAPPNILSYYNIGSPEGYDPLISKRYEAFIAALERGKPDIHEPFGFNRIVNPNRFDSPLFPHLGVTHVLSLIDIDSLPLVFQEGETRVYEVTNHLKKAYIVDRVSVRRTDQEIIDRLFDPDFIPGREAVVEDEIELKDIKHNAAISSIHTADTSVFVQVVSDGDFFLVLTVPFDSWWRATIDQHPVTIYRTNFAFQGVLIPKGTHTVEFTYDIRYQ